MVWCGVAYWCGVVWFGVVWCGIVVWCGMVWFGVVLWAIEVGRGGEAWVCGLVVSGARVEIRLHGVILLPPDVCTCRYTLNI